MGIILSICPCNKVQRNPDDNSQQIESNLIQRLMRNEVMIEDVNNNNNNNSIEDDNDNDISIESNYIVENKLGEGSFGSIYLAICRLTGEKRRLQIYHKKQSIDPNRIKHLIKHEIKLLKSLNHPSLLKVYDLNETSTQLILISDYSEGKELFEIIYKNKVINEEMASLIMYQLLNAVAYFHSNGIILRDLRTENIVLENDTLSPNGRIKILDVGIAMITDKGRFGNKMASASFYIAPEAIDRKYNQSCDLWSCGVILYSMLSGRLPFNANNNKELFEKIKLGQYDTIKAPFDKVSQEAIDLIRSLIRLKPNERLSAFDALNHVWFKKVQLHKMISSFNIDSIKYLFSNITLNLQQKPLKQNTIAFLITHLHHIEEVVEVRRLFNQLDKKQKGWVDQREFVVGIDMIIKENKGYSIQGHSEAIFNSMSKSIKGQWLLSKEDFMLFAINHKRLIKEIHLRDVFNMLIRDKNNQVLIEYLRSVISKGQSHFSSLEFTIIAANVDLKKSGKLTFGEFAQLIVQIINFS